MSWSIYQMGLKEIVKEKIKNEKLFGDSHEMQIAKDLILKNLDEHVQDGISVLVEACGHKDCFETNGIFDFNIKLKYGK